MITRAIMIIVMRIYCGIVYRIKIEGQENLPKEGNTIICSNHVHMLDSISLVIRFKTKRMIRVMAKEELFNTKFKAWAFRKAGAFPIKRGKGDTEALEVAKNYINDGDMLLMFPEGTRNGLDKGIKMKKGAAILALSTNSVIVPIGIKGNYKPFTKIRIRIGKPITLDKYTPVTEDLNPRDIIDLTNRMKDEIIALRDGE